MQGSYERGCHFACVLLFKKSNGGYVAMLKRDDILMLGTASTGKYLMFLIELLFK